MSNTNTISSSTRSFNFWLKVLVGIAALALFTFNYAKAQTNPAAQTLPYSLNSHASSTLPTGWAAHDLASGSRITAVGTSNLAYTASAGNVGWKDEAANSISILPGRTQSPSFVLAINTTGQSNIKLDWIANTIAINSIGVSVGLQYRIGTTGTFTDIGAGVLDFNSRGTSPQSFTTTLPSAVNNQSVVQLRWIYWQDNNGNNPRDRVAIDNITVCSAVTPTIAISANTSPVCSGTSVTYTANITNGGTTPVYQWKVNGGNVGSNSPTYIASRPAGDIITCELTSNAPCASPLTVGSNSINVIATVVPSVSIASSSNPICPGISVTFTATPTNGGASPSYQWKVNGGDVGTNSNQYTTSTLSPGDQVTVQMTSNAICASPTVVNSSALQVFTASLPYSQNFNSTDCWTITHVGATPAGDWSYAASMSNPSLSPVQGTQMAYFNSNAFAAGASSRLMSPRLALNTMSEPYLRIMLSRDAAFPNNKDLVEIYVSTDDGATWTPKALRAPIRHSNSFVTPGWFVFELDLTPFKGSSQVRIALDAVSAAGNNLALDQVSILEATCPVPKNRTVSNISTGGATLAYNPAIGNTSYRIRWTAYSDTLGWLPVYDYKNSTVDTFHNVTGLLPNTKYIWWVSSTCSGSGIGYQCYADTFTTSMGPLPCVKPFNISHTIVNGSSVTGNWDIRITADTFKIRYAELGSSNYTFKQLTGNPGSPSSYTMTGLMANTAYYWQVATVCSGVSTAYSAPDTFSTPAAYVSCIKLYGVYSDNITDSSAEVAWDTLILANEFRARYWVASGPVNYSYKLVAGGSPGNYTHSMMLTNLLPNTTYNYQVRTQCLGYKSSYSDVLQFTTLPAPARFASESDAMGSSLGNAEIFPNPNNGTFQIRVNANVEGNINYSLFDLSGRMLNSGQLNLSIGENRKFLSFDELAQGTYFLKMDTNNNSKSLRIIIQ